MTHYDTLEVAPQASPETIRAAYRSLMQRFHPDKHPGDPSMQARTARLTQAFKVLSDPQRRAAYDESIAASPVRPATDDERADYVRTTAGAAAKAMALRRAARAIPAGGDGEAAWSHRVWWALSLAAVVMVGIWWGKTSARQVPRDDLAAMRHAVDAANTPEAQRRQLLQRRKELTAKNPALEEIIASETVRDWSRRSFELLDAPLLESVGSARMPIDGEAMVVAKLEIPAITVVVGSYQPANALAELQKYRLRIAQELRERLAREDAGLLLNGDVAARLRRIVRDSVQRSTGADPTAEYVSTWFESPGRHGVIDVRLPQQFELTPSSP